MEFVQNLTSPGLRKKWERSLHPNSGSKLTQFEIDKNQVQKSRPWNSDRELNFAAVRVLEQLHKRKRHYTGKYRDTLL